ncbi:DUF2637 domain-containing protein [Plantactinospora sonchi]|uniref:DUF2637 domain-containing protein n=1 Tax=Plantactinospora sonchi TaxID=1544735 RepID=A0ABU7S2B6_9ACTN
MPLPQLRRVRWAVRATLTLGVAASVVANVLHARDNPISQPIAAWPPLALLLTVELISRVPVHRRALAVARWVATATIAGIAAWVSYWHMVGVAARYGETGASPYLLPLSVDGLIVVASICLVELGGRISAAQAEQAQSTEQAAQAEQAQSPEQADLVSQAARAPEVTGSEVARRTTRATPVAASTATGTPAPPAVAIGAGTGDTTVVVSSERSARPVAAPPRAATGATQKRPSASGRSAKPAARPRRPITETAALAAEIQANRPEASDADVAQELGITTARLRAIRREVRELEPVA